MIHHVMSVYDEKAEAFAQPFFVASELVGARSFMAACADAESLLARFPSDYRLYALGTYDDQDGRFSSYDRPRLVMTAAQAVAREEPALANPEVAQRLS